MTNYVQSPEEKFVEILTGKNQAYLSGKNVRLLWQDELEGYTGEINDRNRSIVCAGWNVIIWKGSKAVSLYFGQSLDEALDIFRENNQ